MPVTSPAKINRHWIVAGFSPPEEDADEDDFGALGGVEPTLYDNIDDAKQRARVLAASAPGAYFVVYQAEWYAFTDITPVSLRRVGESVVG